MKLDLHATAILPRKKMTGPFLLHRDLLFSLERTLGAPQVEHIPRWQTCRNDVDLYMFYIYIIPHRKYTERNLGEESMKETSGVISMDLGMKNLARLAMVLRWSL